MTAEELYKEFVEVTHIDESFIDRYEKIRNVKINGTKIIKDVEGITVYIKGSPRSCVFLTYFHKEDKNVDQT